MNTTRRNVLATAIGGAVLGVAQAQQSVTRYVRYRKGSVTSYGILEDDMVRELQGNLFANPKPTNKRSRLSDVKLLYPCEPPKVLAVGLNYKSHIEANKRATPPKVELFYKPTTCLQNPDDPIVIPKGANNVHFEGELVVVIGKRARRVSVADAPGVIFGVTCGNDVSERDWQNGPEKDLQWWRAKGADTFGPLGPAIVSGLDYGKLLLQTRVNGKVMQKQVTSDLLFGPAQIVSFASEYVTLVPGDVIYTGTPGATSKMNAGDICEIDIEGIGVLRNKIAAA